MKMGSVSKLLAEGSLVEVRSREEGFVGAWFEAVVLGPADPHLSSLPTSASSNNKKKKVWVEYRTLISDNDEDDEPNKPLRKLVSPYVIRPRPPPNYTTNKGFVLYDIVDAFYKGGWWTGFVTGVLESSSRYLVTLRNPPEELEFGPSDLRFHRRWVKGKWMEPEKNKSAAGGALTMFRVGEEVEVSFDGDDCRDAWFPSTVVKTRGNGAFVVNCCRANAENEKEVIRVAVDGSHIRPCPPSPLLKNNTKTNFDLLEEVDAFYDFGWWFGVIREVLTDSRYVVVFEHEKKNKRKDEERVFNHLELRPHMNWKDGKWYTSEGKPVRPPCNYTALEDIGENINDVEEDMMTQSASGSQGGNVTVSLVRSKKKRCRPLAELLLQKEGEVSNQLPLPYPLLLNKCKKKAGNECEAVEIPSGQKVSIPTSSVAAQGEMGGDQVETGSNSRNEVEEVAIQKRQSGSARNSNAAAVHETCESGENSGVQNHPATGNGGEVLEVATTVSEHLQSRFLPFKKTKLSQWDKIESRDVFQKYPQKPHFQPLEHVEDSYREPLMIYYMTTFADIIDDARFLGFDGPRSTIDEMLNTLCVLESQGFNVEPARRHLNEILSYKDKKEHLQNLLTQTRGEKEKHKMEKARIAEEVDELKKQMAKLENVIASAQSREDEINKEITHLCPDYDTLLSL
ncbi:unnamed protein product [Cuscuta epithymum]|uniref:Agenet domain-containing protein n=1 Tax=Cuscuta epithymum TaxID=186058 RepID=A0AAV0FQ78_9ASTE|nr:unnamed protein product [Cuscuta epithymum]